MAILEIVKYGKEILRQKCVPVEELNEEIQNLIKDMKETLIATGGVGLAAPQVGVSKRLFIYNDLEEEENYHALINPTIKKKVGSEIGIEGCLSVPGMHGMVERAYSVIVEGTNEEGKKVRIKAKELLARCMQHEYDHLDGVIYLDLVEPDTLKPDSELEED